MIDRLRAGLLPVLAVALALFTLIEVNYPNLRPPTQLATFALLGLCLCFLTFPAAKQWRDAAWSRVLDLGLAAATVLCFGYVIVQTEPVFSRWWLGGNALGERAGAEQGLDILIGVIGLLLVLEATRRAVGLALPILTLSFLAYARFGPQMPDWLFPHRGYGLERIVSQTFLHSQGVLGTALKVMFTYVFLFVLFGALLEATGATRFIIEGARRLFAGTTAGAAKVSVLSSGLMGSLSGSAVANTATTGTFTIPMMRSSGFRPHIAAGVEAAASSGGALVPPVMGAGAYMMLEIVDPPVTYFQIVRAAILPAILYYLSLFLIVHLKGRQLSEADDGGTGEDTARDTGEPDTIAAKETSGTGLEGWIFFGSLGALIAFLAAGFTVFRSVTMAMAAAVLLSLPSAQTRISPARAFAAAQRAAKSGIALVAAAACVGAIIGVVTLTGVGSKLPSTLLPLAQDNLFLALLLLMLSSILLGMGLPSAVCYLLLATLIGPALSGLGVAPLAAHFFIFYFGLMSMVTPPVALAAYTAASIARTGIMKTGLAAFRFALVGFALPFVFVYRPQLLMLTPQGDAAGFGGILLAFLVTALGVPPLAAAVSGYLFAPLGFAVRVLLGLAALLLFWPTGGAFGWPALAGVLLALAVAWKNRQTALGGPPTRLA